MEQNRKKLGQYRDKRAPGITNEPFGDERPIQTSSDVTGGYVVHLHDATRRHYDVRLEVGGVLWSFAVPRGPSLDPQEKLLAIKTEDHPIEYVEFEDVIPDGQYGAGAMIAWDRGTVTYLEGPPEVELAAGKIHVELRGMKLRGHYGFVKLAKRDPSEKDNQWLFFKKTDEHADPTRKITDEQPWSVLSGLTVEELADRDAIAKKLFARAKKIGGRASGSAPVLVQPTAGAPPKDALWDPELDGVRVLALRDGDAVTLQGAERLEAFYPEIVRALRALPVKRIALDGELVVFDAHGRPSRALLAERARTVLDREAHHAVTAAPVVLVVTDILAFDSLDLGAAPLGKRREFLGELFRGKGFLRHAEPLRGPSNAIVEACRGLGIPAVVAKHESTWRRVPTGAARQSPTTIAHRADAARTDPRNVVVTNRTKVFWPAEGYTKGDLVDYYASVADAVGPYLRERPVILVRYPDGIDGKNFFQWNVPVGMPPWVETLSFEDEESKSQRRGFLVNSPATLVYIANLGCIPLHVLAWRKSTALEADFLTLDFDVKQSTLANAITLARTLKELLDEIGLVGLPKTSGQTGLHVLVPLGPKQSFDTARALADLLGRLLVDRHPDIATMERVVARRGPKVYVDTGQTGGSRAIVAPYSVRAVPGATVSTPLVWDEVTPDLDPRAFTIKTVPKRALKHGDLLSGLLGSTPDVVRAVTRLASLV